MNCSFFATWYLVLPFCPVPFTRQNPGAGASTLYPIPYSLFPDKTPFTFSILNLYTGVAFTGFLSKTFNNKLENITRLPEYNKSKNEPTHKIKNRHTEADLTYNA
jgi:hypothetical protein